MKFINWVLGRCNHEWENHVDTEMYYEARKGGETGINVPMWCICVRCGEREDIQSLY